MDGNLTGQRVRFWRKNKGLTQTELADAIGRTQSWVAHVEAGRIGLSLLIVERISLACGIDSRTFLGPLRRHSSRMMRTAHAVKENRRSPRVRESAE
jgi:transcriptional regulator with XRE-family HTH domain